MAIVVEVSCDGCGKNATQEGHAVIPELLRQDGSQYPAGWLYIGVVPRRTGPVTLEGYFCSWQCIARRAYDRVKQGETTPEKVAR